MKFSPFRKSPAPHGLELEIEVFRAGDYGPKGAYDRDALDALAADYDPQRHEAPVTLDHGQTGPAYGWVAALRRKGDRLLARVHMLSEDLIALVRKGAYKKRSIELYRAFPDTGRPYLRALSFLGACPPEVKGLADPVFAEGGPTEAIIFGADGAIRGDENPADSFAAPSTPAPGEALADAQARTRRAQIALLRETLRREGRWLPAWESMGALEFLERLSAEDPIPFSDDRPAAAPLDWFAEFVRTFPIPIPLGEAAAGAIIDETGSGADSLPRRANGVHFNAASIDLHRRACALRRAAPGLPYADALRRAAENPQ